MGSDRASCRMRIALGENHRGSGVTSKVLATWVLSTTAFALPFLRPQSERVKRLDRWIFRLKMALGVYGILWFPVADFVLLIFRGGPSKQGGFAALFGWTRVEGWAVEISPSYQCWNAPP